MSPLRTLNSKIMNRYISTMPVVYISIQSGHLNYFESITVACRLSRREDVCFCFLHDPPDLKEAK